MNESDIISFICGNFGVTQSQIHLKSLGLKGPKEFSTELKIKAFLESLGIQFAQNAKKVHGVKKSPKSKHYYDADFLIPDLNLVIEVNGLAFHSVNRSVYSNCKTKDYHFNKFKAFHNAGYRMLSFSDYELDNMWSSVTEIVKFHLGLLETLSESTRAEYQEFLGYPIEESLNYSLFNKNNLNFENFRLPEDFVVPRMLGGWEYWDCGRVGKIS